MKLTRLKLKNYKQHAELDLQLDGNLIGIIGHNGAGKSNLLGAIQFALSGEQPGFNKSELIRWGTDAGFAEVSFVHNGTAGTVKRALHSAAAAMTFGTEEANGTANVNAAMDRHIGIDKDLLKQAVFARQAEIDDVLFTEPRVRELAFQKLCGIGDAAKLHKRLGERITALPAIFDLAPQISEMEIKQQELSGRRSDIARQLEGIETLRCQMPDTSKLQHDILALMNRKTLLAQLHQVVTVDEPQLIERGSRAAQDREQCFIAPGTLETLRLQLEDVQASIKAAERWEQACAVFAQAGQAMLALQAPSLKQQAHTVASLGVLNETAAMLHAEHAGALEQHGLYKRLSDAMASVTAADCPVCGSTVKDPQHIQNNLVAAAKRKDELNVTAFKARSQATAAEQQYREVEQYNAAVLTTYQTRATMLKQQYGAAEQALKDLQAPAVPLPALKQQLSELSSQQRAATERYQAFSRADAELQQSAAQLAKLKVRMEALKQQLGVMQELGIEQASIDHRIQTLNQQVQEASTIMQHYGQLTGMVQELDKSFMTTGEALQRLKDRQAKQELQRGVVETLTSVRDFFAWQNGPHLLSCSVLKELTGDVNRFLGNFTAPYTVEPDEEAFGFRVRFHDGRNQPEQLPDATCLSGGQKIQLALSFRFASYCMFAYKQGLLGLDEPSAYLDDKNVGCLGNLFLKVKEMAQQMDLQILVVTHARSLMPMFDRTIDLGE